MARPRIQRWVSSGAAALGGSGLQREWVGEEAVACPAPGQGAAELYGVDGDLLAGGARGELAACWAGQGQDEGVFVGGGPFSDDVGHDAPIVGRSASKALPVASSWDAFAYPHAVATLALGCVQPGISCRYDRIGGLTVPGIGGRAS